MDTKGRLQVDMHIDVDEQGTTYVYNQVLEHIARCEYHDTGLTFDAHLRDDPILEIRIDAHTPERSYYDSMEFWVEHGDDLAETTEWVKKEIDGIITRRRIELGLLNDGVDH